MIVLPRLKNPVCSAIFYVVSTVFFKILQDLGFVRGSQEMESNDLYSASVLVVFWIQIFLLLDWFFSQNYRPQFALLYLHLDLCFSKEH